MTTPSMQPLGGGWAEVHANAGVTRYRRSGAGQALLLLDPHDGALWPGLVHALEPSYRILAPIIPPSTQLAPWLAAFLEGLGARGLRVIATGACAIAALEVAGAGTDQVGRMVLIPSGDDAADTGTPDLAELPGTPVPVLVVRRRTTPERAREAIEAFLRGEPALAC